MLLAMTNQSPIFNDQFERVLYTLKLFDIITRYNLCPGQFVSFWLSYTGIAL